MKNLVLVLIAVAAAVSFIACGDDAHEEPPECEPISEGCHDSTTALGMECHEKAHGEWTAAECTANLAMCRAECGFGGGPDAGTLDAASGLDAAP